MSEDFPLPTGKLPPYLLSLMLERARPTDDRVIVGPAIGKDCAVIDFGDRYLVVKSDPITFATKEIGWYLVQVNANDIATSGAIPRWLMLTILFPDKSTHANEVMDIFRQVSESCEQLGVSLIGGHSEITYGLDRPILVGTMLGEVAPEDLITPEMAHPGDKLLLTKGIPIEAVSILAHEFQDEIIRNLGEPIVHKARDFLKNPGISVLDDAQIAVQAGRVTALHDPTEGGLASGLWELAQASGLSIDVDLDLVEISPVALQICELFEINPFAAISSGAMLIGVHPADAEKVCRDLFNQDIVCTTIGTFGEGPPSLKAKDLRQQRLVELPERDEIARLLDQKIS